jgi:peptide/nickel transport system substrate-binding protein
MKKLKLGMSVLLVVLVLGGTLLLAGCGKKEANTTLNYGLTGDIVSLDPAFAYDYNTNPVTDQITEALLAYDANNKLICKLAKSWKCVNPTTYIYEIRNDVHFSDGTPMTADDVVFSLNRYKNPKTASYLGWMYANVASITKTGDLEVTVKLKKPDALWQYVPATSAGDIVSQKYYQAHAKNFGKPDGGVLGTGPYVFKKWTTGSEILLEKNTKYWDKAKPIEVSKVDYKIIPESTTLVSALTSGQVDMAVNPPLDMLDQISASSNVNVQKIDSFDIDFIAFNCQRAPFNDVNVRKAIYYAIDRNSICKNIIKDTGTPANALPMGEALWTMEKGSWANYSKNAPDIAYNLAKAKEYLSKSSVPKGFECTLICNQDSIKNSIALSVQEALKALNIQMKIQKVSADELISIQFGGRMKNGKRDYDMILAMWESDFPDPSGNLTPLHLSTNAGQGGSNTAAYSNPQVDHVLNEQLTSGDPGQRTRLMQDAFNIINEDVPYVMVDYPKKILVTSKRIDGFKINASWVYCMFFKDVHFKK